MCLFLEKRTFLRIEPKAVYCYRHFDSISIQLLILPCQVCQLSLLTEMTFLALLCFLWFLSLLLQLAACCGVCLPNDIVPTVADVQQAPWSIQQEELTKKNWYAPADGGVAEHNCRYLQCLGHLMHHRHLATLAWRRWREDCRSWWATVTSQYFNRYEGLPLRNKAQICRALGGLPLKPPMFLSCCRRDKSSSDVAQDSSLSHRSSSSSSCGSLPLSPFPLYSQHVMIWSRSEQTSEGGECYVWQYMLTFL